MKVKVAPYSPVGYKGGSGEPRWTQVGSHVKGEGVGPGVICSCLKAPLIWPTGVLGSSSLFSAGADADTSAGRALAAPGVPILASPLGPAGSCFTAAGASPSGVQPAPGGKGSLGVPC